LIARPGSRLRRQSQRGALFLRRFRQVLAKPEGMWISQWKICAGFVEKWQIYAQKFQAWFDFFIDRLFERRDSLVGKKECRSE
jgi:hypothetical protein